MFERLVAALVCAAIAAVLVLDVSLLAWSSEAPPDLGFLLEHGLTIFVALAAVAIVLGDRGNRRAWAAGWVGLPCVLALWPESVRGGSLGWSAATVVVSLTVVLVAGWSRFGVGRGLPLLAAPAGALIGIGLLRFHFAESHAPAAAANAFGLTGLAGLLVVAAAVWAGTRPALAIGSTSLSLRVLAGALTIFAAYVSFADGDVWSDDAAPRGSARDAGSPVVVIVLDTLRADHLATYGYRRDTMPLLEALMASEGLVADRAIANAPYSLATHASMFTGLHPPRHGAHKTLLDDPDPAPTGLYPLGPTFTTLAENLAAAGYWTAGVSSNYAQLHPKLGMAQGFDYFRAVPTLREAVRRRSPWCMLTVVISQLSGREPVGPCDFGVARPPYRQAREITDEAIELVDSAGARSFFLFVNYWDAHNPLLPPSAYRSFFPGRLSGAAEADLERRLHEGGLADVDAAQRTHYDAAYDSQLVYLDHELSRLLDRLRDHPRWRETLVIVTSDHGLALGEHGHLGHESQLYDEFTRVPLFVKPGGRTPQAPPVGSRLAGLHESVDVFPLVMAHAGLDIPDGLDGRLWGRQRDEAFSWLHKDPFLAARDRRFDRELRSVQRGTWKLIESSAGERLLFDLRSDPGEHAPLDGSLHADLRQRLASALGPRLAWIDAPVSVASATDPELLERLRSLGYVR